MPKTFYTEKDIEDLFARGIKSLQIDENIVLTGLAYERANRLGIQLLTATPDKPPSAPVRPYLSQPATPPSAPQVDSVPSASSSPKPSQPKNEELANRIRAAVIARLGNQIESHLLDRIIQRVLKGTGLG